MILRDISFDDPRKNILFDDVLLTLAETGRMGESLRFWESGRIFIVLGRIGKEQEDIKVQAVCEDHVPVLRRSSGGGTVLQGPGCLNYAFILEKARHPEINDLRKSYRFILGKVQQALERSGMKADFQLLSDLSVGEDARKFSGNAQRRGKNFILHHGTILYDFNLALIEKYLAIPKDIPEYRKARAHGEFVINIPVAPRRFKSALAEIVEIDETNTQMSPDEQECLDGFLKTRQTVVDLG